MAQNLATVSTSGPLAIRPNNPSSSSLAKKQQQLVVSGHAQSKGNRITSLASKPVTQSTTSATRASLPGKITNIRSHQQALQSQVQQQQHSQHNARSSAPTKFCDPSKPCNCPVPPFDPTATWTGKPDIDNFWIVDGGAWEVLQKEGRDWKGFEKAWAVAVKEQRELLREVEEEEKMQKQKQKQAKGMKGDGVRSESRNEGGSGLGKGVGNASSGGHPNKAEDRKVAGSRDSNGDAKRNVHGLKKAKGQEQRVKVGGRPPLQVKGLRKEPAQGQAKGNGEASSIAKD